jgi:ligand-binding sensor domain-containing protein
LTSFDGNSFQTFTEKDGLCTKNVRAIYEDTKGNLWVGGHQGFCTYNGKEFTRFVDSKGRTYEGIVFIIGDKEDNIWFGGTNGFWKYDGEVATDMTRRN